LPTALLVGCRQVAFAEHRFSHSLISLSKLTASSSKQATLDMQLYSGDDFAMPNETIDQKLPKVGLLQTRDDLRRLKMNRHEFMSRPRRPVTVVLDRVRQNYNIGAIFRLCDAFLVERLIIAGTTVNLRKRKLVQAACGTQYWVPWVEARDTAQAVTEAKATGNEIIVVEQTGSGIRPENLSVSGPICVILGAENDDVDQRVIDMADLAVTIPMLGMANSLNVASAAAIVLHHLSLVLPIG